jgi:hypothetical protein
MGVWERLTADDDDLNLIEEEDDDNNLLERDLGLGLGWPPTSDGDVIGDVVPADGPGTGSARGTRGRGSAKEGDGNWEEGRGDEEMPFEKRWEVDVGRLHDGQVSLDLFFLQRRQRISPFFFFLLCLGGSVLYETLLTVYFLSLLCSASIGLVYTYFFDVGWHCTLVYRLSYVCSQQDGANTPRRTWIGLMTSSCATTTKLVRLIPSAVCTVTRLTLTTSLSYLSPSFECLFMNVNNARTSTIILAMHTFFSDTDKKIVISASSDGTMKAWGPHDQDSEQQRDGSGPVTIGTHGDYAVLSCAMVRSYSVALIFGFCVSCL